MCVCVCVLTLTIMNVRVGCIMKERRRRSVRKKGFCLKPFSLSLSLSLSHFQRASKINQEVENLVLEYEGKNILNLLFMFPQQRLLYLQPISLKDSFPYRLYTYHSYIVVMLFGIKSNHVTSSVYKLILRGQGSNTDPTTATL